MKRRVWYAMLCGTALAASTLLGCYHGSATGVGVEKPAVGTVTSSQATPASAATRAGEESEAVPDLPEGTKAIVLSVPGMH